VKIKKQILSPVYRSILYYSKVLRCEFCFIINKPVPLNLRNFYIVDKYKKLSQKYRPGLFDGEVLLFRSDESPDSEQYNGWESLVKKVNVIPFQGAHLKIAREKEYAKLIGDEFNKHLNKVFHKI
jgi:thioesterase domain-containing protein